MNEILTIIENFFIVASIGILGGATAGLIIGIAVSYWKSKSVIGSQIKRSGRVTSQDMQIYNDCPRKFYYSKLEEEEE